MSSSFQRVPFNVARQMRNKQISHPAFGTSRLDVNMSHLRQEVQQAKINGLEDIKENMMSNKPGECTRQQVGNKATNDKLTRRGSKTSTTAVTQMSGTRKNSVQTATTRSCSTLSHPDGNVGISNNTDSCYSQQKTTNNTDVHVSTTSCENSYEQTQCNNDINNNTEKTTKDELAVDNELTEQLQSFVLTLDQLLEDKAVSRLKGDITGKAQESMSGHVRALNGGRLTNAQEVVVTVCHNDHRKLVFHDQDEENLNNAKTTSDIRIALWMKYNEGFQPDNSQEDIGTVDNEIKTAELPSYNTNTTSDEQLLPKRVQTNAKNINKNRRHPTKNSFAATKQNGLKQNGISSSRRNRASLVRNKNHNVVSYSAVKFLS